MVLYLWSKMEKPKSSYQKKKTVNILILQIKLPKEQCTILTPWTFFQPFFIQQTGWKTAYHAVIH